MNSTELKSLLEEVFFEDKYSISEIEYEKYNEELVRFYIKVYSEKLSKHIPVITVESFIIGTTICKDVWEMTWSLPNHRNYYMKIPGTSIKRNPKDVGDSKGFLMLSKEKINDILLINELNNNLLNDMKEMSQNSNSIIRDFKLKQIVL